ncbi:alpha/beta hydrolase [Gordonia sp. TBRC 11910]|uniref:Alpha/beta hydrolase n=2 Tax=Gordonia asplenii TaxID=2725283 RepID=A0A848KZY6_9ACTN|nr:alpha/beta hydrolase [Gordonia asplenii]
MIDSIPRPPIEPELAALLAANPEMFPTTITPDMIPALKVTTPPEKTEALLEQFDAESRDVVIDGHDGHPIVVSIIGAKGRTGTGPGFYHTHGGGMFAGDRFAGIDQFVEWAVRYNGVLVTVDYRLAPEFPDPYPIEDCYSGLKWTADNADELGIDPDRLIIGGASAGGGLAAGLTLLARDRKGPAVAGSLVIYPMLDERNDTVSARQIDGYGFWDRTSMETTWNAYLGDRRGTDAVSIYAAPTRATDLSGLPPTFLGVGAAEVFRDEVVAYASAIWAAGGDVALHVWPGAFHGVDLMAYDTRTAADMRDAHDRWIRRLLEG